MTTKHTPYDYVIAGYTTVGAQAKYKGQREDAAKGLSRYRLLREGYLQAVADYADLLAAAEVLDHNMAYPQTASWVQLRAAITKARGQQS